MKKLVKRFVRMLSSSNFIDMGDEMMFDIQKIKNIRTGIIVMNFEDKGQDIFEIKCSLVYNVSGSPSINEEFNSTYIHVKDLPKYIGELISMENGNNILKISEEDIENISATINVPKQGNCRWANVIDIVKDKKSNNFELQDMVFFTILNCFDDGNNIVFSKRIGVISEMPQKVYDAVYPFKKVVLKIEDF